MLVRQPPEDFPLMAVSSFMRSARVRIGMVLLGFVLLAGCERSKALGLRPDLSAVWDVMHDDVIDVELRVHGDVHRARVARSGGRVVFHDAGTMLELEIDCTRPELVCPGELLARELRLDNRTGDISDDGENFALSFAREGQGACRLLPGSAATADIETRGSSQNGTWIATALTGGVSTALVSPACFGDTSVPEDAQIALSSGFTAARR
jgi:hypothetical protein